MIKQKWNILPYTFVDGVPTFRDSDIIKLYEKCVYAGIKKTVFHDGKINSAQEFLEYIKNGKVYFWSVSYDNELVGMFWLNRLDKTSAYIHFTAFPDFWGRSILLEAGRKVLSIATNLFPLIMGMLPSSNRTAINFAKRVGMKILGEVPNLIWSETKNAPCAGTICYITKYIMEGESTVDDRVEAMEDETLTICQMI